MVVLLEEFACHCRCPILLIYSHCLSCGSLLCLGLILDIHLFLLDLADNICLDLVVRSALSWVTTKAVRDIDACWTIKSVLVL